MSKPVQGMIFFADDVRDEIGGKTSVMGVVGSEVEVTGSRTISLRCIIMFWGRREPFDVTGSITVEGAPADYVQPRPLQTQVVPEDTASPLVQIVAKLRQISLSDKPVKIKAAVDVDGTVLSAQLKITHVENDAAGGAARSVRRPARQSPARKRPPR